MGLFRVLVIGLFIVAIPAALITTNIRLAVSQQRIYDYSVRTYDAAARSGIPEEELIRSSAEMRRYLTRENPGPLSIQVMDSNGEQRPLLNSREIAHMADVRQLVQRLFDVQVMAVAAVLTLAVVVLVLWPPRALAAAVLYGSLLTGGLLGMVAVLAVAGFDSAWSQFHVFAFSNDLWRLNPDRDHLIQMFPQAFWQRITILIGAATLLQALLLSVAAAVYLLLTRQPPAEQPVRPAPDLPGPGAHSRARMAPPNPRHYVR